MCLKPETNNKRINLLCNQNYGASVISLCVKTIVIECVSLALSSRYTLKLMGEYFGFEFFRVEERWCLVEQGSLVQVIMKELRY